MSSLRRSHYIVGRNPVPRQRSTVCGPGQTRRKSYVRRSSSGKRIRVPARCIPGRGLSAVLGPARRQGVVNYKMKHEGILRRHGYKQTAPAAKRRIAIQEALKEWPDALGLLRHMNLIVTRSRNRDANRQGLINMADDIAWLGKKAGYSGFAAGRQSKSIKRASTPRARRSRSKSVRGVYY